MASGHGWIPYKVQEGAAMKKTDQRRFYCVKMKNFLFINETPQRVKRQARQDTNTGKRYNTTDKGVASRTHRIPKEFLRKRQMYNFISN